MSGNARISRTERRRIDSLEAQLLGIATTLGHISMEELKALVVRDGISIVADGYPSSSRYDIARQGGEVNSTTEGAVLARERPVRDELRQSLRGIERALADARDLLEAVESSLSYVRGVDHEIRVRQASTPCPLCELLPAVKAGFCIKDLDEWHRAGRPDRHLWVLWKTQAKSSEGDLLVADQPPPADSRTAIQPGRDRLRYLVSKP